MTGITAAQVIEILGLMPLPGEGGFFAETYRTSLQLPTETGTRHAGTAIYFLITPEAFSALHRLAGDELYHFYAGDPVNLVTITPQGKIGAQTLGSRLELGERPQLLVPGGYWQGSALVDGGSWALLGTTMTPGYHPDDFELGKRAELIREFPQAEALICQLTRGDED